MASLGHELWKDAYGALFVFGEGSNAVRAVAKQRDDLLAGAVAQPNDDGLCDWSSENGETLEVAVFGDDDVVIFDCKSSNRVIRHRTKTVVPDMR